MPRLIQTRRQSEVQWRGTKRLDFHPWVGLVAPRPWDGAGGVGRDVGVLALTQHPVSNLVQGLVGLGRVGGGLWFERGEPSTRYRTWCRDSWGWGAGRGAGGYSEPF